MNNLKAIILSAGKGTRMKSSLPKVAHKVCGKEMVNHVITASKEALIDDVIAILGHGSETVKEILPANTSVVYQYEQLGTGHAVMMAKDEIEDNDIVIVLCGDTPLIKSETLRSLIDYHRDNGYLATVLTTEVDNPTGYGRVIRDEEENLVKIVEEKDANQMEKACTEINSGIYCFNGRELKEALDKLDNNNAQGEYYLTDTIKLIKDKGLKVGAFKGSTIEELMGVNSRVELSKAEEIMRRRINESHMVNGVTIIDINSTYIESDVIIGNDTIIYPSSMIRGNTEIGSNCIIGQNSNISNSKIANNVEIVNSTVDKSIVGESSKIGPYAYLRPDSVLGKNVKIGDFVEVKKSNIGDNSKASHLSYIGDAEVGENVNIGCGVVFVNYDGKNKNKSIVKDGAFIGSNSNLVAPVIIEEKGYIATGSTITNDVPEKALAIARERQINKEGWNKDRY
jgi:bifunctional UDP-N-acetylglucosamine pyrophosphorylase/glucosamine-1-phosphate N-acetyltransferase